MSELSYLDMIAEAEQQKEEQEETEVVTRFRVTDEQKAEWCLQKRREAEQEKAKWKAHYDGLYKAIADSADRTIEAMDAMLREYFESVPHKKTATQESYKLPSGKLVLKKVEPEYKRDDETVIKWLKANSGEGYVKVKEDLDWASLKKAVSVVGDGVVDENGEVVPGITVTPKPDVFKVEVK